MGARHIARKKTALPGSGALLLIWLCAQPAAAQENMKFHGELITEPCVIAPGDDEIQLDFGTIVDRYLYLNTRTHGQPFAITLTECDLSLGNGVSVTFGGAENPRLPGLLAIDGGSGASGIAIGLETGDGEALPLNSASGKRRLHPGISKIPFQAYVMGEPDAIRDKTIGRGAFSATATFTLNYE